MEQLVNYANIKVKCNKTNQSFSITKYKIKELYWDLSTRNIIVKVLYWYNDELVLTNDFSFEGASEVDVWDLIKTINNYHYGSKVS